jgi:hypothetical protein
VTDAVSWRVPVRTDTAVADMGHGVEAIDLARARLLREGWDMAVCMTDAPLRIGRRPVVADASATHGLALISLPALGAVQTRRRARDGDRIASMAAPVFFALVTTDLWCWRMP